MKTDIRLNILSQFRELQNLTFKVAYYEEITTISGQIVKPPNATILLNEFGSGINALICKIVNGKPDFEDAEIDISTFDAIGNYITSGVLPSDPSALIYYLSVSLKDYQNLDIYKIIEYSELTFYSDLYAKLLTSVSFKATTSDGTTKIISLLDSNNILKQYVDSNGFMAIRYRDEYVGGDWVLAAGGAAPDIDNYTIGGIGYRLYGFDGNKAEERLSNSFEMPHDVAFNEVNSGAQVIEAHIHWMPSSNNVGNVEWFFDWTYMPINSATIPQISLSCISSVSANQQYFHKIEPFKDATATVKIPVPVGGFILGDIILFTLRRTPNGDNDTYPDNALLIKVALHVPINDFGSRQIYIK